MFLSILISLNRLPKLVMVEAKLISDIDTTLPSQLLHNNQRQKLPIISECINIYAHIYTYTKGKLFALCMINDSFMFCNRFHQ